MVFGQRFGQHFRRSRQIVQQPSLYPYQDHYCIISGNISLAECSVEHTPQYFCLLGLSSNLKIEGVDLDAWTAHSSAMPLRERVKKFSAKVLKNYTDNRDQVKFNFGGSHDIFNI